MLHAASFERFIIGFLANLSESQLAQVLVPSSGAVDRLIDDERWHYQIVAGLVAQHEVSRATPFLQLGTDGIPNISEIVITDAFGGDPSAFYAACREEASRYVRRHWFPSTVARYRKALEARFEEVSRYGEPLSVKQAVRCHPDEWMAGVKLHKSHAHNRFIFECLARLGAAATDNVECEAQVFWRAIRLVNQGVSTAQA